MSLWTTSRTYGIKNSVNVTDFGKFNIQISKFQNFKISKFQNFKISKFTISKFQISNFSCFHFQAAKRLTYIPAFTSSARQSGASREASPRGRGRARAAEAARGSGVERGGAAREAPGWRAAPNQGDR